MPRAWTDALDAAIAAGKIPNIPIATNSSTTGEPTYGKGTEPAQADICSSTAQCRIEGDIWDAPAGVIGIGFDDGPLPVRQNFISHESTSLMYEFRLLTIYTPFYETRIKLRPIFSLVPTYWTITKNS